MQIDIHVSKLRRVFCFFMLLRSVSAKLYIPEYMYKLDCREKIKKKTSAITWRENFKLNKSVVFATKVRANRLSDAVALQNLRTSLLSVELVRES